MRVFLVVNFTLKQLLLLGDGKLPTNSTNATTFLSNFCNIVNLIDSLKVRVFPERKKKTITIMNIVRGPYIFRKMIKSMISIKIY